ncbi:methyl-accepting chemotaxis protein [Herbaspirillum huttiense]|uniref:methyl-accepting chemotaxis protein n=1 Tax=Herbaspirillum huttiense TaxID=863372 RepID=UPI0031E0C746
MKNNLPVTQRAFEFPDGVTLMSTTDTQSHITYANAAFIAVSGFSREELLGQPHNLVRHPDMPPQAFADMWKTLQAGRSWTALVKNRRSDGDHYWVRANATPIMREGRITGYMSVRTKPSHQEIERTENLYRRFRENRANGLAFEQGLIVRKGLWAWTSLGKKISVAWRLRVATGLQFSIACAALLLAGAWQTAALPWLLGLLAAGAVLGGLWLERKIAHPLGMVLRQSLSVAAGQAGENMHLDRIDEIGMIMRAVNQSGLNLRSLVDDVDEQVMGVQSASGAISKGNYHLSERTEQAASNLEETASSMEQIDATVRNNADAARQAADLARGASDMASRGGNSVQQVVQTMQAISHSSQQIADIITVIDGIAFQTNILALNAAVEAARAGEQGRGFAVVAGEVRTLARRSAEAAKEIKELIGDSVSKVDAGTRQVDEAGQVMQEIVVEVQRVTGLIAEISHASAEQSTGIGQVNGAVSQLEQMTQQNAALVEESAAAADRLRGQADRLAEAVQVFKTSAHATHSVPRSAVLPRLPRLSVH